MTGAAGVCLISDASAIDTVVSGTTGATSSTTTIFFLGSSTFTGSVATTFLSVGIFKYYHK
jgi:uncharacterized protein (DUF39 family)